MLSVQEYATQTGKDPGNIRRMLVAGRLPGMKIGNQWVIEENTPYPTDRRIRSGEYRGWRKRVGFTGNRKLSGALSGMLRDLREIYGNKLEETILYGSYARGDATEDSDIDVAVLIAPGSKRAQKNRMLACVAAWELYCGKTLSVVDIDYEQYNEWKKDLPYYKNIDEEGVVLWKNV